MHTCSLEVLIPSHVERQFKIENNAGLCINVEMMLHVCREYNRYGRGLSYRNIKNISNLFFHLQSFSSNTILKLSPICLVFFVFFFFLIWLFLLTQTASVEVMVGMHSSIAVDGGVGMYSSIAVDGGVGMHSSIAVDGGFESKQKI